MKPGEPWGPWETSDRRVPTIPAVSHLYGVVYARDSAYIQLVLGVGKRIGSITATKSETRGILHNAPPPARALLLKILQDLSRKPHAGTDL